jgi:outer membrane protein insertion porin family
MGGQASLRGFEFRGAGPTQFGRPTGGELQFLGGLEYSLPIFSTRMEGQLRETELVRAVAFTDFGMLGDSFDDDFFWQLRASSGFGVRIIIPGLGNVPMALDFGWPWMRQASDQEEVFSFTFRTN